jgi:hypothetical protein
MKKSLLKKLIEAVVREMEVDGMTTRNELGLGMKAVNVETNLNEVGRTFYTIVVLKYNEAKPAVDLLKTKGINAAVDYMKQWDMGGESEHSMSVSDTAPWGKDDKVYKGKGYTIFYNPHQDYIGLVRFGTKLKEQSSTGAVAGYSTPFAFTKNKSGSKRALDVTKKMGFKPTGLEEKR